MSAHKFYVTGISFMGMACLIYLFSRSGKEEDVSETTASTLAKSSPQAITSNRGNQPAKYDPATGRLAPEKGWELEERPFAVTHRSDNFEWTSEDGKKAEIIKQLVKFQERADILERNNEFTLRRQLVYLPSDFRQTTEKIFDGDLSELPVPGFDGEEFTLRLTEGIEQFTHEGARPLTATFAADVYDASGRKIEGAAAVGAFTDNIWSIEFNLGDRSYVYDNRLENQWVVTEYDEVARANTRLRLFGNTNDILSNTDNVGVPEDSRN